jgi:hypothetical protein
MIPTYLFPSLCVRYLLLGDLVLLAAPLMSILPSVDIITTTNKHAAPGQVVFGIQASVRAVAARVAVATVNRGGRRALTLASQHTLFQPPSRRETVLLGCVSYDPSVGEIWGQLKSHFVNTGGVPNFDYVLFSNYEQQVRALLDSHIDISWNGPIAHVMSEERAAVVSLGHARRGSRF